MQVVPSIAPSVFTLFNAISFVASVASLVLSVVAIILTLQFKRDADKVNYETTKLLFEIRSDAKTITEGVMSELRAYGNAMRGNFARNGVNDVMSVVPTTPTAFQVTGNRDASSKQEDTPSALP